MNGRANIGMMNDGMVNDVKENCYHATDNEAENGNVAHGSTAGDHVANDSGVSCTRTVSTAGGRSHHPESRTVCPPSKVPQPASISQTTALPTTALPTTARAPNVQATGTQSAPDKLDDETLALAVLTYCLNTADALMTALLKGTGDAVTALRLIRESSGNETVRELGASTPGADGTRTTGTGSAAKQIERMFCTGLSRWGTKPTPRMMQTFHRTLESWHQRLASMPTWNAGELAAWFTMDGEQWIIGPRHPCWPHMLDDLTTIRQVAAPLCLWGRGNPAALVSCDAPVGIVGSRGANDYGTVMARGIAERAAHDGHTVVSGGAMGIDAAAHWGALAARRVSASTAVAGGQAAGRTVAVFAGGLNHMGPQRNADLFARIETEGGALISEMCPGTIPEARRFLARNRIIAALSSTLVVAQARLRSGALSTASWAGDLNRVLYALPGDIDRPGNAGCNRLIHDGKAILFDSLDHVSQICHEAHAPVADGGGMPTEIPDIDAITQEDDGPSKNETPPPSRRRDQLATQQRDIVAAIRRLKRLGRPATVQSVTEEMASRRQMTESPDAPSETDVTATDVTATDSAATGADTANTSAGKLRHATAKLLPWVLAQLGQLEMMGIVAMNGGDISILKTNTAHAA